MKYECDICSELTTKHWTRCEEHYRCDDCKGTANLVTRIEGVICEVCHALRMEVRIAAFTDDTIGLDVITCPHCGYEFGDCYEYDSGDITCHDCSRGFYLEVECSVTYTTEKEIS